MTGPPIGMNPSVMNRNYAQRGTRRPHTRSDMTDYSFTLAYKDALAVN